MAKKRISPPMVRTTVRLTKAQKAALEELAGRGEFKDKSEAGREAIRQLLDRKAKKLAEIIEGEKYR